MNMQEIFSIDTPTKLPEADWHSNKIGNLRNSRKTVSDHLVSINQSGEFEETINSCLLARDYEESGDYETAIAVLDGLWTGVGERPDADRFPKPLRAEILARVGVLTSWLGSIRQIAGAQEKAKDLLSESMEILAECGQTVAWAEVRSDMAVCYWREGSFSEARIILQDALSKLSEEEFALRGQILLRLTNVEISTSNYEKARAYLQEATPLIEEHGSLLLHGKLYFHRALVCKLLAENETDPERRAAYFDSALTDYSGVAYYYEIIGHSRYLALVENNLGSLLLAMGKVDDVEAHLRQALRLFTTLNDEGRAAQAQDSLAKLFIELNQLHAAEEMARASVQVLQSGDEQPLLVQSLITLGQVLARLDVRSEAVKCFRQAASIAERIGEHRLAGTVYLTLLEEMSEKLLPTASYSYYLETDSYLASETQPELLARLRRQARNIITMFLRTDTKLTTDFMPQYEVEFLSVTENGRQIISKARQVAPLPLTLLITGETGTGKKTLAKYIHAQSGRHGSFIHINCNVLADTSIESYMLAQEVNDFSDKLREQQRSECKLEGCTLFLDGVGALNRMNQAALMRLIDYGEIQSLKSFIPKLIDARIIAATSCDLERLVEQGKFSYDLYNQLMTYMFTMPPLRDQIVDIPAIANSFLDFANAKFGKKISLSAEAINVLCQMRWYGNVRELESLIERVVSTVSDGTTVTANTIESMRINKAFLRRSPG